MAATKSHSPDRFGSSDRIPPVMAALLRWVRLVGIGANDGVCTDVRDGGMARVGVITGPERERRWRWSAEQKRAIVAETQAPGVVTEIARRRDKLLWTTGITFTRRRLASVRADVSRSPVTKLMMASGLPACILLRTAQRGRAASSFQECFSIARGDLPRLRPAE